MKHRPRIRTVRQPCARCGKPCIRPDGYCTACSKLKCVSMVPDYTFSFAMQHQSVRFLAERAERVRQHTERVQSALAAGRR